MTVTSVSTPSISAQITIDYEKKLISLEDLKSTIQIGGLTQSPGEPDYYLTTWNQESELNSLFMANYSKYTIDKNYTYQVSYNSATYDELFVNNSYEDMWLDSFNAYDEDAQAADFFAAIDIATSPATEIVQTLPIRFRKWVETLKPTKEAFLLDVFRPESIYLNFNYTEFLETIYHIPSQAITYIHGCRTSKKHELILGHAPDASEFDDWTPTRSIPNYKSNRKAYMINSALDVASRTLIEYDEATTKDTSTIINNHNAFFSKLTDIKNIVVIGHSLSVVDYPYFKEIITKNNNIANWFISWHSSRDLENTRAFAHSMNIPDSKINLITLNL